MSYRELFKNENNQIRERYDLAVERIALIENEQSVSDIFSDYFKSVAGFILAVDDVSLRLERDELVDADEDILKDINESLYRDILPEHYEKSYANTVYAETVLGKDYGKLLSVLYAEVRGMITYAYECRRYEMTICMELFLEIYNYFIWEAYPQMKQIRQAIYWYISDYSDVTLTYRLREVTDASLDCRTRIVMCSDLSDDRYLYQYGMYISENERQRAEMMRLKSEAEIQKNAADIVDTYVCQLQEMWKNISDKKTVNIQYAIGHERLVKAVITNLKAYGFESLICAQPVQLIMRNGSHGGVAESEVLHLFSADHRYDEMLFMDKALVERKLSVLKVACEQMKAKIQIYAGALWINCYDEDVVWENTYAFTEKQLKLLTDYMVQRAVVLQKYTEVEILY